MRLLLDTHVLLWASGEPQRLGRIQDVLLDEAHELFVSSASAWEITIKHALGRLTLPERPETWFPTRIRGLGATGVAMEVGDVLGVGDLPPLHADPFDRVLVATARRRGWTLVSADAAVAAYDVPVLWR
ncbi:MAG: type II toxin-antitoxin system VapC family toxin [Nocardioides sp.]